jgi:hypothetical protein
LTNQEKQKAKAAATALAKSTGVVEIHVRESNRNQTVRKLKHIGTSAAAAADERAAGGGCSLARFHLLIVAVLPSFPWPSQLARSANH